MDDLLFIDDEEEAAPPGTSPARDELAWIVLVADDDPDVHKVTHMALQHFQFQGRPLHIVDCYSGHKTLERASALPALALILLDVVMEADDAGIQVARALRASSQFDRVQIVVRTAAGGYRGRAGFRGIAINGFVWQNELNKQRLDNLVTDALAAYCTFGTPQH